MFAWRWENKNLDLQDKYSQTLDIYWRWAKEFGEPETQIGLTIKKFFNFEEKKTFFWQNKKVFLRQKK